MPTRSVNLTPELDQYVARKIETGKFETASEVMRAGLRALEREEREDEARLSALRAAIDAGFEGEMLDADEVFAEVEAEIRLHSA